MKDVLIINSYAGSLVLGVRAAALPIRASYEDCGYGINAQKANWPEMKYVDNLPWPIDQDLSETIVMSHPPCAAFSNQNSSESKRGTDAASFQCHRNVMTYAMSNRAAALCIESVPGAIAAAGDYAAHAERYGYEWCVVQLNAITFGVPQWRPRMWTLFFRKDLNLPFLKLWFRPNYVSLGQVVNNSANVELEPPLDKLLAKARRQIPRFNEYIEDENTGSFVGEYPKFIDFENDGWPSIKTRVGPGYNSIALPRKLSRIGFAPTVFHSSFWFVDGRPLTRLEYQRIMGFPDEFIWPEKMKKDFRLYLSKGVCPPVATWVAQQLWQNVHGDRNEASFNYSCSWGSAVDLEPKKQDVIDYLERPSVAPKIEGKVARLEVGVHEIEIEGDACAIEPEDDSTGYSEWVEVAKPKIKAKMVGFYSEPVNGALYEYRDGVMSLATTELPVKVESTKVKFDQTTTIERKRASSDELKARATSEYKLAEGVVSKQWTEGAHAYAIVRALELFNAPASRSVIVGLIENNQLIKTTMPVERAVAWMLNELVKKGKVVQC